MRRGEMYHTDAALEERGEHHGSVRTTACSRAVENGSAARREGTNAEA